MRTTSSGSAETRVYATGWSPTVTRPKSTASGASTKFSASCAPTIVAADPHVDTEHLVIALGDCHGRVSGIVRDSRGGLVPHARISSEGLSSIESSTDGMYELCLAAVDEPGIAHAEVRGAAHGFGRIEEPILALGITIR